MPKIGQTLLTNYVGIDPGQSGGLALMTRSSVVRLDPMPKTESDIWDWFDSITIPGPILAVIEKVHSFPGQGVSSTFKFGQNYGFLRACLIASGISFQEVTPQAWMKGLGIVPRKKTEAKSAWKQRLKGLAQQWHPQCGVSLATADALLIARYCQLINKE